MIKSNFCSIPERRNFSSWFSVRVCVHAIQTLRCSAAKSKSHADLIVTYTCNEKVCVSANLATGAGAALIAPCPYREPLSSDLFPCRLSRVPGPSHTQEMG